MSAPGGPFAEISSPGEYKFLRGPASCRFNTRPCRYKTSVYIGNLESAGVLAGVARRNILAVCRDGTLVYYITSRRDKSRVALERADADARAKKYKFAN